MRISFVLSSLRRSGGVLLVIEYANRLALRHHQVALVVPNGTVDPALRATVHSAAAVLECELGLPVPPTPLALLRLSWALAGRVPPSDVLVATHTPTVMPVLTASVLKRKGRRVWLYMDYAEMFRGRPIESALLKLAPRWFDCVTAISQPLAQQVARFTKAQVVVTGSGLRRPDLFRVGPRRERSANERRVLYVGDDRPRKGLREVIQAAESIAPQVPGLKLIIASKQPCTFTTALPCEFHLRPSDEELADLYRTSGVFVSASWGEGLGYPPLEAMACGTPVALTNSEGVLDYARDEENCLLVPPRDVQALAHALKRLLTDEILAQRLTQNGLTTVKRYDWDETVDRFESVLASL